MLLGIGAFLLGGRIVLLIGEDVEDWWNDLAEENRILRNGALFLVCAVALGSTLGWAVSG